MQATYLYLTRPEWAETWISGGTVPIALASKYRSIEREGTLTPDENLIHDSPVDIASLRQMGFHFENVRGLTFNGNTFNGRPLPDSNNAS